MTKPKLGEAELSELERSGHRVRQGFNVAYLNAPTSIVDDLVLRFSAFQAQVDKSLVTARAEAERYRVIAINHTALLNAVAEGRDKAMRQIEDEPDETMKIAYAAMFAVYEAVLAKAEQLDTTPDTPDDPLTRTTTAAGDEYPAFDDPAVKPESVEDREEGT